MTPPRSPEDRARAVKKACDLAERNGQIAAGIFLQRPMPIRSRQFPRPLRRVSPDPGRIFHHHAGRARHQLGQSQLRRRSRFRSASPSRQRKSPHGQKPAELAPGKYTVILEPAAVLDLVGFLFYDFAATALADQRSCLSERIGKPLLGKNISITDDVYHPQQLGAPFDGEGIPRQRVSSSKAVFRAISSTPVPPQKNPARNPPATASLCPTNTAKLR